MPYSLRTLTQTLSDAGISEPEDEAALLLEAFAGVSRASLLCDRDRLFDSPALETAVTRRLSHEPIQYILGTWEFYGLPFTVSPRCLIPRPDTETLVYEAVRRIPRGSRVADLCTGSGCIAVSVLSARPDITCTALELFPDTLALAQENARRNGVSDRFTPLCADLLDGGAQALADKTGGQLDAILSNPPYIRTREVDALAPELFFEPRAALDGGDDGLVFYRAILGQYRPLLRDGGLLLLEIGFDQADDLRRLSEELPGWTGFEVIRDLGGRDRVICLRACTAPAARAYTDDTVQHT